MTPVDLTTKTKKELLALVAEVREMGSEIEANEKLTKAQLIAALEQARVRVVHVDGVNPDAPVAMTGIPIPAPAPILDAVKEEARAAIRADLDRRDRKLWSIRDPALQAAERDAIRAARQALEG